MAVFNSDPIMFALAGDSPAAWLFSACQLRNAGAKVDWIHKDNISVNPNRRLPITPWRHNAELALAFPVYRLLMGLSFENLLKGILIARGTPSTNKGKLARVFQTHTLSTLLSKVEKPPLVFSPKERELIAELERFVKWQGRYPIPTDAAAYIGYMLNNPNEHELEHALWNRLRDHLVAIGWHKDVEGNRYKLKREGSTVSIGEVIR